MALTTATAQDLTLSMMPSYTQSRTYANGQINKPITIWGRVSGGTAPYTYTMDCGDGTVVAPRGVSNPNEISKFHTYTSGGSKVVTLTVSDYTGAAVSKTATVRVLLDPTVEQRANMAVEKGLLYLYRSQIPLTVHGYPGIYFRFNTGKWAIGEVGAAALAFIENGHFPGYSDKQDIYAETVRKALNFITMREPAYHTIYQQPSGNPDSNGNGKGISLVNDVYASGFASMALVLAYPDVEHAKTVNIPAGPLAGASYYDVVCDIMDQFAFCQGDYGELRGAWRYGMTPPSSPAAHSSGADGSAQQWPCLLFLAAQQVWGHSVQPWVIGNADYAYRRLQNYYGGIGYHKNSYYVNQAKSGAALIAWALAGKKAGSDGNVNKTLSYIGNMWYQNNGNPGWIGSVYAMYGLKKGLQLQGLETVAAPGGRRSWQNDLNAWLLGDHALTPPQLSGYRSTRYYFGQLSDGSWKGNNYISGYPLNTATAVLVMTRTITIPKPTAVISDVSIQPRNFAFQMSGTESHHVAPTAQIVAYDWDFNAADGLWWERGTAADARGSKAMNPGYALPGTYTVTLRVTDNNPDEPQTDITTKKVQVTDNNAPPVAVPISPGIPSYSGKIGETITIDGSHSYDPENDPIIRYEWDLDGDGQYDDAVGERTAVTFEAIYSGQIGLRVTSQDSDGIEKSSSNRIFVDVFASPSDLFISDMVAANIIPGESADITVTLNNNVESGQDFGNILVCFYDENPFTGGTPLGSSHMVALPVGGSETLSVHLDNLSGVDIVYAYLDANEAVGEWDEANNTASASVSNQPPTVELPAPATLEATSGIKTTVAATMADPDSDPLSVTWTVNGQFLVINSLPSGAVADSIEIELPLGVNEVRVTVDDGLADAVSAVTSITLVDTIAPVITCTEIVVDTDPGLPSAVVNYAPSATDAVELDSIVCNPISGTVFPVGSTAVTVTAVDTSGNSSVWIFDVTVSDVEPPFVLTQNITLELDVNGHGAITPELLDAGSSDNCGIEEMIVLTDSFNIGDVGTNAVTLRVADIYGNISEAVAQVTVVDNIPPIVITKNITVELDENGYRKIIPEEVDDGTHDAAKISLLELDKDQFTGKDLGDNIVTLTAYDYNGNSFSGTAVVTVVDVTPPVLTCADILVHTDPRLPTANVNYSPQAADAVGVASVVCEPPSGSAFPVGTTVVTATATDTSGNRMTRTFTVTVTDVEVPVVRTRDITVQLDVAGYAQITSAMVDDGSSDNVGIAEITVTPDAFTVADVGPNMVTLMVTDLAGNRNTATAVVMVEDNIPPTIITQDITVELGIDGAVITPEMVDNGSHDAAGIASLKLDIERFGHADVGIHTVSLTATDVNGNSASKSARVTVLDVIAPVLALIDGDLDLYVGDTYTEPGATVADLSDPNLAPVIGGDVVDTMTIGTYLVTYNSTDASGNAAIEMTRTVRVLPRFAMAGAMFGFSGLKVGKDVTVNGGLGSRERIDIHNGTTINGNVVSTTMRVDVENHAQVNGDITAGGKVQVHKGAVVTGTITENVPTIIEMPLPGLAFIPGDQDIKLAKNEQRTLAPGKYGELRLGDGASISLSDGIYTFASILMEARSRMDVVASADGVIVNVAGDMELKRDSVVTISRGDASQLLVQVQGAKARMGSRGSYEGTFLAPNASIELNDRATLTGSMIGADSYAKSETVINHVTAPDLLIRAAADWVEPSKSQDQKKGKRK